MSETQSFAHSLPRPFQRIDRRARGALGHFAALFEVYPSQARATALEIALACLIVAIGAGLRFYGLGAIGLHGDEKTMALPVVHLLRFGTPEFPTGMLYVRAIGQLYLMAAAVKLFGLSEWAMRLPSALCGVLLMVSAYFAGRRFLSPPWNLAFTAAVAALPAFIEDAQTARMYVFLVTSVAAFSALVFRWERTQSPRALIAAVAVLIIGLQFHTLAIFAALVLLYPGLLHADLRRLWLGAAGLAAVGAAFVFFSDWTNRYFPDADSLPGAAPAQLGAKALGALPHPGVALLSAGIVVALLLGAAVFVSMRRARDEGRTRAEGSAAAAGTLTAAALVAQLLCAWHVGVVLMLCAGVLVARAGRGGRALMAALALSAAVLGAQLLALRHAGISLWHSLGALAGWPSIWPQLTITEYSRFGGALLAAAVAFALWRLSQRRAVPDFLLYFVLAVWVPLLLIGMFKWYIPLRYSAAQSLPFLLCALAGAQWLSRSAMAGRARPAGVVAAAALCAVLAIGPVSFARNVDGGYADHPDHKGAAAFVRAQHPGPHDILLAEDVIVQTYYLGHVDYWLAGERFAGDFVHRVNGRLVDFYTGTPLIYTGAQLQALIDRPDRGAIYIIGSGEAQGDGRAYARGPGIQAILHSAPLRRDVVFIGRDHLTRVWRVPPPHSAAARPH